MAAENGIKIMSVNLLLDNEEDPVIWRGPVIAGVVKQFWNETVWGDIDYLFVDMPPNRRCSAYRVPVTPGRWHCDRDISAGISADDREKAYNMADMMHIPVLGVVENFSYLECPDCGKKINVFGQSHVDEAAQELGIPVFGKLPVDPAYAEKADEGKFFEIDNPYLAAGVETLKNL